MKATPVNLLNTGRPMRKCSRCRRLKAVFPSSTGKKAHGGVSDVCWTCGTAAQEPRKEVMREETKAEAAPRRPGRPNEGSVWLRNGIYQVTVTVDGKTRRVSSKSGDRAVAQALLASLLSRNPRRVCGKGVQFPKPFPLWTLMDDKHMESQVRLTSEPMLREQWMRS